MAVIGIGSGYGGSIFTAERAETAKNRMHSYRVDAGRVKQSGQEDSGSSPVRQNGDSAVISEEGRSALREKMSELKRLKTGDIQNLPSLNPGGFGIMNDFEKVMSELGGGMVSDDFVTKDYSQESVDALKARFEQAKGTKTDTFDSYVNKMASAYQLMKERIEDKYAASDRKKEFYVAEDGSTQELTREKELEMLDKAYGTHSRFMATTTQIWSELRDFKAQTTYHSGWAQEEKAAAGNKNPGIKEQAYHAFLSAVSEENTGLLKQKTGILNQLRLNLDISSSGRNVLNGIWDYWSRRGR